MPVVRDNQTAPAAVITEQELAVRNLPSEPNMRPDAAFEFNPDAQKPVETDKE